MIENNKVRIMFQRKKPTSGKNEYERQVNLFSLLHACLHWESLKACVDLSV